MVTPFMHPSRRTLQRAASEGVASPRLRRHLGACDRCRARLGFLRDLSREVRLLDGPVAGDRLRERIHARIAAGDHVILPEADPRPAARHAPRWIAAGVAAVLAAFWVTTAPRTVRMGAAAHAESVFEYGGTLGYTRGDAAQVRVLAFSSAAFSRTDLRGLRAVTERLARRGIAVHPVASRPADPVTRRPLRTHADSGEGGGRTRYYVMDRLGRVRYSGSDPDTVFARAVALSQAPR
jgi:hypothetical protein